MTRIAAAALLALTACAHVPDRHAGGAAAEAARRQRHQGLPPRLDPHRRRSSWSGSPQKSGAFTVDYARTDEELEREARPEGPRRLRRRATSRRRLGRPAHPRSAGLPRLDRRRATAFVGTHSASDTFPGFAPFIDMLGGHFKHHGPQVKVDVLVKDAGAPVDEGASRSRSRCSTRSTSSSATTRRACIFFCTCEAPGERARPASSRSPGRATHGKGRVFYTALGHREDVLDARVVRRAPVGRHRRGPWGASRCRSCRRRRRTTSASSAPAPAAAWRPRC